MRFEKEVVPSSNTNSEIAIIVFEPAGRPFTTHPDFVTFHVNTPVSGL
jgi:hypothetical protein